MIVSPVAIEETRLSMPNERIVDVGSRIINDTEYRNDPSWSIIAIVYNFLNGRQNSYGYIFLSNGEWKASLPQDEDDAILDKMLELQAAMERETGKKWIKALVHINRADQSLDVKFEYDDPEKWVINPGDLEASVAALKP